MAWFTPKKSKEDKEGITLPQPETQVQECLYLMIKNNERKILFMTRKDFMDESYIMNAPACIHILRRKHNVAIKTYTKSGTNKFGRPYELGMYKLENPQVAKQQYINMVMK